MSYEQLYFYAEGIARHRDCAKFWRRRAREWRSGRSASFGGLLGSKCLGWARDELRTAKAYRAEFLERLRGEQLGVL